MNQKNSPASDIKKTSPNNSRIIGSASILGLLILAGIIWFGFVPHPGSIEKLMPNNTAFLLEINIPEILTQESGEKTSLDIRPIANNYLQKIFPESTIEQLEPWIGSKVGVALLPENEFLVAASYRSKSKTKKFLQQFLLPDETLQEEKFEDITIYTPQFSSQLTFAFHDGWFVIGSSKNTLITALNQGEKLGNTEYYKSIKKSFPSQLTANVFINSELFLPLLFEGNQYLSKKPLFETIAQALPAVGLALNREEGKSTLYSKIITKEGMFTDGNSSQKSNKLVPELAQFSTRDSLFFMNGIGLYEKYKHTKSFLEKLHPQFGIILDGVLRAETQKIFGKEFDFEEDFLKKTQGQYALIFDFEDPAAPFTHFTLLTKFNDGTNEETAKHLQDIAQLAQGTFSPQLVEIELPDGTTRKELVAVDKNRIPLTEVNFENQKYFTVQNAGDSDIKFSYGFLDNFLIFSTQEQGVRNALKAYNTPEANLTSNEDFRTGVLFDFPPSASYGFINTEKLASLLEFKTSLNLEQTETQKILPTVLRLFRNATFARRAFKKEILWTFQFQNRK